MSRKIFSYYIVLYNVIHFAEPYPLLEREGAGGEFTESVEKSVRMGFSPPFQGGPDSTASYGSEKQ